MSELKERDRLVEQARRHLEAAGRPRLVMLLVLVVAGAAGFLASVALLHLGLDRMWIRYPLAVAASYATFLGMLRAWLRQQTAAKMLSDDPEGLLVPGAAAIGLAALGDGVGDGVAPPEPEDRKHKGSTFLDGGSLGDFGDGPGALVILVLIAGICALVVGIVLVVTSPALLAELLVDGALLGAMSRAMTPESAPHWSRSVVRRTWIAALVTAIVFGLVGFGIERVAPGARTLSEAWAADARHR